ncbi:MAG TPA: hypothetical protein VJS92_04445 [Candidatus Polarisedimenticolaceae bacterium]|nr:hypothetical protein [Candidatus Polarisedimenticolaceae bacterium]
MKKASKSLAVVFALLAALAGGFSLLVAGSPPVAAAHCRPCPLYCIGVTCDDGRTYCNSCLAACAGAHHCVVTG